MTIKKVSLSLLCLFTFLVYACDDRPDINPQDVAEVLSALPDFVEYPSNNPYSIEKENLGRVLFWDPILSGDKDVACASCHHPSLAYTDARDLSAGVGGSGLGLDRVGGDRVKRNSPTIINSAYNGIDENGIYSPTEAPMFWDIRALSLERQAIAPILTDVEMKGHDIAINAIVDTILQRLNSIEEYRTMFEAAFGTDDITRLRLMQAIATFERGIVANNSPFDQYMRGNESAMSDLEIAGMVRFVQVGCAECHSGAMLSDYELHVLGVPDHDLVVDNGANDELDFRTPTLRNVELTAPYMHNGEFATLREVVEFYDDISDGRENAINSQLDIDQLAEEAQDVRINNRDIDEIVAFMRALTDDDFDKTIPAAVPSGLAVGGNIE